MKFFFQDKNSEYIDTILKALNKLMDGDISQQMKQKGLKYKLNYGASILWLRQLSKKYKGNNELADRLWHREIRETMILATLIINPEDKGLDIINEWIEMIPTNEIAEQLGANTLWKIKHIFEYSSSLLNTNDNLKNATAWVALSTYLQRGNNFSEQEVDNLLAIVTEAIEKDSQFDLRVKGRFLRQLCRQSKIDLNKVENTITNLHHNKIASWLVEDVKTEISFLKEK